MSRIGAVVVAVFVTFCANAAYASPITYKYTQTSTSVPGHQVSATVTIDGTFADLPMVSLDCYFSIPCLYTENGTVTTLASSCLFGNLGNDCVFNPDFGHLLDFELTAGTVDFSLGNFTTPGFGKRWWITPGELFFADGY